MADIKKSKYCYVYLTIFFSGSGTAQWKISVHTRANDSKDFYCGSPISTYTVIDKIPDIISQQFEASYDIGAVLRGGGRHTQSLNTFGNTGQEKYENYDFKKHLHLYMAYY